jgi:aminopeptidase N
MASQSGHPQLNITWSYLPNSRQIVIDLKQTQKAFYFHFPMEIALVVQNGETIIKTLQIDSPNKKIELFTDFEPAQVILNPNTWLLFEGKIQKK